MMKTKIVCTIGPASEKKELFIDLVNGGLSVARLNFSHGDHKEHQLRINMIKEVRRELKCPVSILLDTKGPEIRTGTFTEPEVLLEEGKTFTIWYDEKDGNVDGCSITYKSLHNDVKAGDRILIDDGLVELKVEEIIGKDIKTTIVNTGIVKNHKGVNVPNVIINLPAITEKDRSDILFGIKNDIDFIAASFIRKASDVMAIRKILEENGAHDIHIISKIENQEGVDNIDEIIEVSDGIMVARGDLGVEIPTEEVPIVQKMIIKKCNRVGKPVITATQMLDSMIRNPRPTRAETTDVANAIFDGTDAVMLSGETAAGKYPAESVKMMATIAQRTESAICYKDLLKSKVNEIEEGGVTFAVGHATVTTANELEAKAIITATSSGFTARKIAMFRPVAPILAATYSEKIRRKLTLIFGVQSILMSESSTTDEIFENAIDTAKVEKYINSGDLVVITAGVPVGIAGTTNLMKVHIVEELMIKGLGFGKEIVTRPVKIIKNLKEAKEKFKEGDIIVTDTLESYLVPFAEKSAGFIVEEAGYTSPGALVAINLHLPAVVGALDATSILEDNMKITLDAKKGLVYSSNTKLL
ncbi:MAG: pyruvate kinase [Clostridiales bacterium]|nr:pyruvate kinase [Clostridiales bacterium]